MVLALLLAIWAWEGQESLPKRTDGAKPSPVAKTIDARRKHLVRRRPAAETSEPAVKAPSGGDTHRICVQDAQGAPVEQMPLRLYCSDTSAPLGLRAWVTDQDGCVSVLTCPGQEPVTCVRLSDPRYRRDRAWVLDKDASETEFRLASPAVVRGSVRDTQGNAVSNATLWFEAQDPDPTVLRAWVQSRLTTDASGAFAWVAAAPAPCDPCVVDEEDCEVSRRLEAGLAPAPGKIWIRHPGYALLEIPMAKAWGNMGAIELEPGAAKIQGRVVGGKRARIELFLRHQTHALDRQRGSVHEDGTFSFEGLGGGEYELSVFLNGQRMLHRRNLSVGDEIRLEL